MEVRLLGPVDVMADDGSIVAVPGQKLQHLLAALALERGRVVTTDRLVSIVYGERPPRQPSNSLQVLVSRLRRSLPATSAAAIETTDAGYRLAAGEAARTDIERFNALVAAARNLATPGDGHDPVGAGAHLRDALDLVRGEPLAGLPDDGWARGEKARLTEAQLAAVEERIDADLAAGAHAEVVPELESLTGEHPLRERLWCQLMLALYRSGRQGESLRAFGDARRVLVDELGIEPGPDLRRLEAAVLAQDPGLGEAPPPLPTPPRGVHGGHAGTGRPVRARGNVPRPLTLCLGRDDELAEVLELVADHRLVTLVGPGGTGKTRLGIEAAHALAPATPDGVWLVDLAATRDADGVLLAFVRALGLDEAVLAGSPVPRSAEEVADAVADRTAVLLVDNCEHVVDDVARLVEVLLAGCPDLAVLATSRETLGVPGEFLFVVPPLPLESAVALFVERMAAGGRSGPAPAERDEAWHGAVADICRRLDGLPLAVELAAARARHLDVTELAARLDRRFDVLVEGPRTAQPRQRTLRAVVDWSYELLDEDERRVFERLSVFSGSGCLDAARFVCTGDGVEPGAVEGVLGRLVDKSLVTMDGCATGTRFTMLQTLADYAGERLAERGEAEAARRRHATWVHDLTATVVISTPEAGHTERVRAVQAETANLHAAISWAVAADPGLALRLAANLGWHWFTTMQAGLAWTVLTTALARAHDAPDELVARAKALAGLVGTLAGHREAALALSADAEVIEREIADPDRLGWYSFLQASQRVFSAEPEPAQRWLDRAEECFRRARDEHGLSAVAYQRGVVAGMLGDLAGARHLLEGARDGFRRLGNHMTLMATLARLGEVAERDGRPEDAFSAWAELREMAVEAHVPALVTLAAAGMALVRIDLGDRAGATRLADEAMAGSLEGFSPVIGGYALAAWGTTQAAYGDSAEGVERVQQAAGLFSRVGYHGGAAECWRRLARISALRGDDGDAVRWAEHAVACADKGHDLLARSQAHACLEAAQHGKLSDREAAWWRALARGQGPDEGLAGADSRLQPAYKQGASA